MATAVPLQLFSFKMAQSLPVVLLSQPVEPSSWRKDSECRAQALRGKPRPLLQSVPQPGPQYSHQPLPLPAALLYPEPVGFDVCHA